MSNDSNDPRRALDRRDFLRLAGVAGLGFIAGSAARPANAASPATPAKTPAVAPMPTRNLGRTAHRVPLFSLGGQAALEAADNYDVSTPLIERALDLGVNYIDTAAFYGRGWSQRHIGLDLIVKERIRDFIKAQCIAKGMTVILTTHDLGDIEELCKRVIIIDDGRIIYDGPIETIKKRFGKFREITFDTLGGSKPLNLPDGAEVLSTDDHKVQIRFDRTISTASKVAGSIMSQIEVTDFSLSEPDLGGIVKQIYNGALDREAR
jgi:hypothetical protein